MRIISGKARGCKLFSLDGDNTRPTTDRVKESMFSMIQFNIFDSTVLDLFAGSGALGLEALSRGAAFCDFVEQQKDAADIVAQNIKKSRLDENARLHNMSAEQFLKSCNKKYDVVFLDPPYNKGLCVWAVKEIYDKGLISDDGIFVCETSADEILPFEGKRKVYGKIAVTVLYCVNFLENNKEETV